MSTRPAAEDPEDRVVATVGLGDPSPDGGTVEHTALLQEPPASQVELDVGLSDLPPLPDVASQRGEQAIGPAGLTQDQLDQIKSELLQDLIRCIAQQESKLLLRCEGYVTDQLRLANGNDALVGRVNELTVRVNSLTTFCEGLQTDGGGPAKPVGNGVPLEEEPPVLEPLPPPPPLEENQFSCPQQDYEIDLLKAQLAAEKSRTSRLEARMDRLMRAEEEKPNYDRRHSQVPKGVRDRRRFSPERVGPKAERDLSPLGDRRPRRPKVGDETCGCCPGFHQGPRHLHSEDDEVEGERRRRKARRDSRRAEEPYPPPAPSSDDEFLPKSRTRPSWVGPKHRGIRELSPRNSAFRQVLSYRRYRLINTSAYCGPEVTAQTSSVVKSLRPVMKNRKFDGTKPMAIVGFLALLKRQFDQAKVGEGAALLVMPEYLGGHARDLFDANFDAVGDDTGGFTRWPEAVQYLLRTYAKDHHIEGFVAEVEALHQAGDENEASYARRLRNKANECAGVYTDQDLITRFIRGLKPDLKPLVSMSTFDKDRSATFMDYVDYATAQGDAHRALGKVSKTKSKSRTKKLVKRAGSSRALLVHRRPNQDREDSESSESSSSDDEQANEAVALVDFRIGSYLQEPASISEDLDEEIYAIVPNRNPRLPSYAQPTREQRPGWVGVENKPNDICFNCYQVGHKNPLCPHHGRRWDDPEFDAFRRHHYALLSDRQRTWLAQVRKLPTFALAMEKGQGAPGQVRFRHPVDLPRTRTPANTAYKNPPPPPLTPTLAPKPQQAQAFKAPDGQPEKA